MKTKVIILIAVILLSIVSVSATYDSSIENGALDSVRGTGSLTNLNGWDSTRNILLVAIYESNEHHNQLLEEQNLLLKEQNRLSWINTCYKPFSTNSLYGNSSSWKTECANAGYPTA